MARNREGSLEAARRQPLRWQDAEFYDTDALNAEMARIFDVCHTCRRCVSLCAAFPTLFDLIDESSTMEVDGVAPADYSKVVDHCYLCDLCAEVKCPYLPPHEFAVDFPQLMLRAKAKAFTDGRSRWRDRLITSTDTVFAAVGTPGIAQAANAANAQPPLRRALESTVGIHHAAPVPQFHSRTFKKRAAAPSTAQPQPSSRTTGRVALFTTCYGNWNEPDLAEDLVKVLEHNALAVTTVQGERCCGMPKFELGDLKSVARLKAHNVPLLARMIDAGYDVLAPVPSCVLMFKLELPLMYPEDAEVKKVRDGIFDPFEYLSLRHKEGLLDTDFRQALGKVAYHTACHQRVQNIGRRTKEILDLIPETEVEAIERCSGHDGTYALKRETYENAMKIARPTVNQVKRAEPDHYGSDCPMAGRMIEHGLEDDRRAEHPASLLRRAYGI